MDICVRLHVQTKWPYFNRQIHKDFIDNIIRYAYVY
jgi:hypothetical protein